VADSTVRGLTSARCVRKEMLTLWFSPRDSLSQADFFARDLTIVPDNLRLPTLGKILGKLCNPFLIHYSSKLLCVSVGVGFVGECVWYDGVREREFSVNAYAYSSACSVNRYFHLVEGFVRFGFVSKL
jgi:hypothetical protein